MATARCTWDAVSGVDGYNVYLKSNGEFVKQNSELITETVYDIENLEEGNYEAYATSVLNSVESEASNVKEFTTVPVVPADIDTFSYDNIGAMLDGVNWASSWLNNTNGYDIVALSDSTPDGEFGTKLFKQTSGSFANTAVHWVLPGSFTDAEALYSYNTGSGGFFALMLRLNISNGVRYEVVPSTTSGNISIRKTFDGSTTTLDDYEITLNANTWYYIRFSVIGTSLKAKIWAKGTSEPAGWHIETTDSDVESGYLGLRSQRWSEQRWVDFVSLTNGATAQLPS